MVYFCNIFVFKQSDRLKKRKKINPKPFFEKKMKNELTRNIVL